MIHTTHFCLDSWFQRKSFGHKSETYLDLISNIWSKPVQIRQFFCQGVDPFSLWSKPRASVEVLSWAWVKFLQVWTLVLRITNLFVFQDRRVWPIPSYLRQFSNAFHVYCKIQAVLPTVDWRHSMLLWDAKTMFREDFRYVRHQPQIGGLHFQDLCALHIDFRWYLSLTYTHWPQLAIP